MTAVLDSPTVQHISVRTAPPTGVKNSFWLEVAAPGALPLVFYSVAEAAMALNFSGVRLWWGMPVTEVAAAVLRGAALVGLDHIVTATRQVRETSLREMRGAADAAELRTQRRVWTPRRESRCTEQAANLVSAAEKGLI